LVIKGGVGGVRFRVIGVRSRLGFTVRLGSGMRETEVRDGDFRRGADGGCGGKCPVFVLDCAGLYTPTYNGQSGGGQCSL